MIDPLQEQIEDLIGRFRAPNDRDREMAVRSLARIGPRAVPQLLKALRDEDWNVRRYSASVFKELRDARALPALCELAGELDWEVRLEAMAALRAAAAPGTLHAVLPRLADNHPRVRALAAETILEVHPAELQRFLREGGVGAFGTACTALHDWHEQVRSASVRALACLGDPRGVDRLGVLIGSEEPGVELEAIRGLGILGGENAVRHLTRALRSGPAHSRAAAEELVKLAECQPTLALREALASLRRSRSQARWLGDDDQAVYGKAISAIEHATRELRDLPLPSIPAGVDGALPLPALGKETASLACESTSQRGESSGGGTWPFRLWQRCLCHLRKFKGFGRLDR